MTIPATDMLLLDTTILFDIVKNNRTGQELLHLYSLADRPDRPLISVVTLGELLGMAKHNKWTESQIEELGKITNEFVKIDLAPDVLDAYADLYAFQKKENHTMGQQNDMWIAATAKATKAILLTGDKDFNWLHPNFIQVEYVERNKKK